MRLQPRQLLRRLQSKTVRLARYTMLAPRRWRRVRMSAEWRSGVGPFTALVIGVPREAWDRVDQAYPEYVKLFAMPNAKTVDLLAHLPEAENGCLILGADFPPRTIQRLDKKRVLPKLYLTEAPIPQITTAREGLAHGFALDSLGFVDGTHIATDLECLLNYFDIWQHPQAMETAEALIAEAQASRERARRTVQPGRSTVVALLSSRLRATDAALKCDALMSAAGAIAGDAGITALVRRPLPTPDGAGFGFRWDVPTDEMVAAIMAADHVVTDAEPLAAFAVLAGVPLTTTSRPFYGGWGLTEDVKRRVRRVRTLTRVEFVAIACVIYPRYVAATSGRALLPSEVVVDMPRTTGHREIAVKAN